MAVTLTSVFRWMRGTEFEDDHLGTDLLHVLNCNTIEGCRKEFRNNVRTGVRRVSLQSEVRTQPLRTALQPGDIMATREAYQKKLEAHLKEWDAKLDQWSAKAQEATADARIAYESELEKLKGKRAEARQAFDEMSQRGENAWEEMKDGMEKVWDDMGKAMEKFTAHFK